MLVLYNDFMSIIEVNSENAPALKTFKHVEWEEPDKEHYGNHRPDFDAKHAYTFVAQEDGEIQGYVSFSVDAGIALINSFIVGKKFRGKGVGKLLLAAAEKKLMSEGAHKVSLETGADWEARKIYEKLGYRVRAHLPNHFGHQEFVLMDKFLV